MSKQDRNGVRTAQDLERKYDLASLVGIQKSVENSVEGINKTNKTLEEFMASTLKSIDDIYEQMDGNITTWFYPGVPSLSTLPASEWTTDAVKNEHLGDLYYNQDTGFAYRFAFCDEEYKWIDVLDNDIAEALALANSAQDTADSKRRVFVAQPEPPYDNGDLWFNNGEIFICQIAKASGETFATDDFIIATNYTDDTLATQIGNELEVVRGTVTTIKESQDEFRINLETTTKLVDQNKQEVDSIIENMTYSFGTKDLTIASSTDPVNSRFNNQGVKVYTYKELNSIFNHNGTGIQKLIVVGDSQIANLKITKAVDEDGNACTDFHHLISNIQSLSDLED
jgi:phage-related protein